MGKKFKDNEDAEMQALLEYYEMKDGGGDKDEKKWVAKPRCHESHPVLKVGNGFLCGGSCSSPRPGFDVYVGLDQSMSNIAAGHPWLPDEKRVVTVYFPIQDYSVPKDKAGFKSMCEWLCKQLRDGKKVHIGCIGGHGRTGMVMAGIMAVMGEKDAIGWVRKNHCQKAVESNEQVAMLVKMFGIVSHPGAKMRSSSTTSSSGSYSGQKTLEFDATGALVTKAKLPQAANKAGGFQGSSSGSGEGKSFTHVASKKAIWRT